MWVYLCDLTDLTSLAASEATHSDYETTSKQSPIVSSTNTLSLSSFHGCKTEALNQRQSGMILIASRQNTSTCPSTSLSEDFPTKTSISLAEEREYKKE